MDKLEKFSRIFKITMLRWLFEKYSKKCDFGKNCKGISLEKIREFFYKDFHVKLKVISKFFTRDFPGKKIKWKKILKGFLWKIEAEGKTLKGISFIIEIGIECWAIPAIDLLPPCLWWSESEVKWSESEWVFGPLNLFVFRYIKEGVWGNNNIGIKKCTTIFLWVLNLGQVGGRQKKFQNLTTDMIF